MITTAIINPRLPLDCIYIYTLYASHFDFLDISSVALRQQVVLPSVQPNSCLSINGEDTLPQLGFGWEFELTLEEHMRQKEHEIVARFQRYERFGMRLEEARLPTPDRFRTVKVTDQCRWFSEPLLTLGAHMTVYGSASIALISRINRGVLLGTTD